MASLAARLDLSFVGETCHGLPSMGRHSLYQASQPASTYFVRKGDLPRSPANGASFVMASLAARLDHFVRKGDLPRSPVNGTAFVMASLAARLDQS